MSRRSELRDCEVGSTADRLLRFFRDFVRIESSSSLLLLTAAGLGLAWANSPWSELYFSFWQTKAVVGVGTLALEKPLLSWINEALMALFFFVIGLEIKRELLVGPLADTKRAALSVAAALGGIALPAATYIALNHGVAGARGWAIPTATDIAFALGILALFGDRVCLGLKVFLAALVIADDIGAVLIIALFFTTKISWLHLGVAAVVFACLLAANAARVRQPTVYALLGIGLWMCFLYSGVHATVAGILVAASIPACIRIDLNEFVSATTGYLSQFTGPRGRTEGPFLSKERSAALYGLERACKSVETPLQRLERQLHPWVAYAILPVFALANAGVAVSGELGSVLSSPVALGVALGLLVGKPLGIVAFSWLAVRVGIATIPPGVTWGQILGVGCLAGIGFTMSLFIGSLAFDKTPALIMAKMGIFSASILAGILGCGVLWLVTRASAPPADS
jgi:NhaA family Na+:H+ antiporter